MAKKKAKTGVYLLTLEGGGDRYLTVVNKETYEWITSEDLGQPAGSQGKSSWEDQLVPPSQVEPLKSAGLYPLRITIGSYDNDRALAARPMEGYERDYDSIRELMAAIRKNRHELIDEYDGCIY